ncbi:unnamed protein product, partial [marine sediment metagenome]
MISPEEEKILEPYLAECKASEITIRQMERISNETGICLRKVEWFAVNKEIAPQRYLRNLGTFSYAGQLKLLEST